MSPITKWVGCMGKFFGKFGVNCLIPSRKHSSSEISCNRSHLILVMRIWWGINSALANILLFHPARSCTLSRDILCALATWNKNVSTSGCPAAIVEYLCATATISSTPYFGNITSPLFLFAHPKLSDKKSGCGIIIRRVMVFRPSITACVKP